MSYFRKFLVATVVSSLCLTFAPSAASASPATETANQAVQTETALDIGVPDDVLIASVEEAVQQVPSPEEQPEQFEQALNEAVAERQGQTIQPRALPAIPIAIGGVRVVSCMVSAYPTLNAIDGNTPYAETATLVSSAILGCVGGAVTGKAIANWIINNPRVFGTIANAIGLGHLTSDSPQ